MDGFHVESVPQDELDALVDAEVSDPVPAEETLDGNDQVLAVGFEDPEELVAVAGELLVHQSLAGSVKNADVEAAGVEVDAAVVTMLLGVQSHRGLLSGVSIPAAYRSGRPEGASTSIPGAAPDGWRHR